MLGLCACGTAMQDLALLKLLIEVTQRHSMHPPTLSPGQGCAASSNSVLLDFDEASFGRSPAFVQYDFNRPEELPKRLAGSYSLVVIDPPFITEPVWRQVSAHSACMWCGHMAAAGTNGTRVN